LTLLNQLLLENIHTLEIKNYNENPVELAQDLIKRRDLDKEKKRNIEKLIKNCEKGKDGTSIGELRKDLVNELKLKNDCPASIQRMKYEKRPFHLNRILLENKYPSELKKHNENNIKSWEELKSITETLNFFNQYIDTKDKKYLDQAYEICNNVQIAKNTPIFTLFYNIGLAYFEENRYKEAEMMFDKAIKANPTPNAYCGRGICRKYLQKFWGAMDDFERIIYYDNKLETPLPWYLLGAIYLDLGCYAFDLYDKAIGAFCEAIKRNSEFPYPYLFLGIIFHRKYAASKKWEYNWEYNSKLEDYIDIALDCIKEANDLAIVHGHKDFSTSPTIKATCLLQKLPKNGKEKKINEAKGILLTSTLEDDYNNACVKSIVGNYEEAKKLLKTALKNDRTNSVQALFDPDLYVPMGFNHCEEFLKGDPVKETIIRDIRYVLCNEKSTLYEKDDYIKASFEAVCGDKEKAINYIKSDFNKYDNMSEDIRAKARDPIRFEQDPHFMSIHDIAVLIKVPKFITPGSKIPIIIVVYNTGEEAIEDIKVEVKQLKGLSFKHSEYILCDLEKRWDWDSRQLIATVDKMASVSKDVKIEVFATGRKKNKYVKVSNSDQIAVKMEPHVGQPHFH